MPLSDTGVSQRFSTCSFCRCSLIICRPASPNCVAHRFKYLNAGNFISCSAHADVTEVKARLRHSRLPRARPPSRRATSASVARTGSVSFRGPPFCCWREYIHTSYVHGKTLDRIYRQRWYRKKKKKKRRKGRSILRVDSRARLPIPAGSSASGRERRNASSRIPWTRARWLSEVSPPRSAVNATRASGRAPPARRRSPAPPARCSRRPPASAGTRWTSSAGSSTPAGSWAVENALL